MGVDLETGSFSCRDSYLTGIHYKSGDGDMASARQAQWCIAGCVGRSSDEQGDRNVKRARQEPTG